MNAELPSRHFSSRAARLLLLGLIVLLGAYLRFEAAASTVINSAVRADAAQYVAYAFNLRLHQVYSRQLDSLFDSEARPKPDALRVPGYPLFLYPFTWTLDLERFAKDVVFAQALFSIFTIVLAYVVAVPVLGVSFALGVALLTALSPHLVSVNTYLLTESLFAFLLMLGLFLIQRAAKAQRWGLWSLAGVVIGAAALTRPTLQYFVVVIAVLAATPWGERRVAGAVVPVVTGFLAVFGLWVLRNWLTLGVTGDATLTINTVHHGMYPGFMYAGRPESYGFPYRYDPRAAEIATSLWSVLVAIVERFRTAFFEHALWYAAKPIWLFKWGIIAGQGDVFIYPTTASPYYDQTLFLWTHRLMLSGHPVVVALAFAGAAMAWVPRVAARLSSDRLFALRLISATYVYYIAVHVVGAPFPRYSIPIRPLTYILGLVPVSLLFAWWKATWGRGLSPGHQSSGVLPQDRLRS